MTNKLVPLAIVIALAARAPAEEQLPKDIESRQYYFDAALYSCMPDDVLTTYRGYGGGGVAPNGTLGMWIEDHHRHFEVTIKPRIKSKQCLVTVKVVPDKTDTLTQAQEVEYNLTDIVPKSMDLARDDNGRVYRLNLLPRFIDHPKPKQFEVNDLHLGSWSFDGSPVVMNDQEYMGRLSMSGGTLAYCDFPGLAKIEFSLLHLKNAEPEGTLKDGVIEIKRPGGPTLKISGVTNGTPSKELSGGPYTVWVRWKKPTMTVEEYRQFLKQQIELIKERMKNGDVTISPAEIERVEKMSQSEHIGLMGNGVMSATPGELEHSGM